MMGVGAGSSCGSASRPLVWVAFGIDAVHGDELAEFAEHRNWVVQRGLPDRCDRTSPGVERGGGDGNGQSDARRARLGHRHRTIDTGSDQSPELNIVTPHPGSDFEFKDNSEGRDECGASNVTRIQRDANWAE
jgi:hypothetical protein